MRLLFLVYHPVSDASSRYRIYQYINYLEENGIRCTVKPLIHPALFKYLSTRGNYLKKTLSFFFCSLRRFVDILTTPLYSGVVVQKALYPVGPLFPERLLFLLTKKVIFDFDDAIYLYPPHIHRLIARLKRPKKVNFILKHSKQVLAGNPYLAEYAKRFNPNVAVVPTVINMGRYRMPKQSVHSTNSLSIGWIGSRDTSFYLKSLSEVLTEVSKKYKIILKVIGVEDFTLEGVEVKAKKWSYETEIMEIKRFDIGICPLPDDDWTRGKCGLKVLQYMAAGIPTICSPVGVHKKIIQDGINGFLAGSEQDWIEKLSTLIEDDQLRECMGKLGRETVEKRYAFQIMAPKLLKYLLSVIDGKN